MGPVNETAEIVLLIQAAKVYPVTQAERHALRDLDVVSD